MARSSVATDDFNRASLGSNWSQLNSFWGSVAIFSSTVYAGGGGAATEGGAARWNGSGTFADDQYSTAVWNSGGFFNLYIGVLARASADTDSNRDYYYGYILEDSSSSPYTTALYKVVNGTATSLGSGSKAWADGDRIEIECEGTTIRLIRDNAGTPTTHFSVTDSALTSGKPGVWSNTGGSSLTSGDDWEGGSITGGAATTSIHHILNQ